MLAYFDYRPGYLELKEQIDEAIHRVLDSGQLILGPEVRAFEQEFAAYVGVQGAVGVNSGTDALILGLRSLGVGSDDEVITVANAGVPPVAAIRAAGATPRFVDVDPDTLLMDPAQLEGARTERTRCVLPVHLYGQPAPLDEILEFAERHDLRVLEDCAQAHGSRYRGAHVGSFGAIGGFSFYPTKNLGAFGDGGLCVCRDPDLEERLRSLRTYGFRNDRHAHVEGLCSRLDEIQAAVLRVKLQGLSGAVEARRELARDYLERLEGSPYRPVEPAAEGEHAFHLFVARAPDRPRLAEHLKRNGIGFGIHYAEPVHLMEAYRFLGYHAGDLPATEAACETVISLPLFPGMAPRAVEQVVTALLDCA